VLRDAALPDLHAGATSLSGLLRSGLGRFGLQAGPKPSDCPTVILFVVGGLSIAGRQLRRGKRGGCGSSGGGWVAGAGGRAVPCLRRLLHGQVPLG
jgi:hypothetical protein